MVRVKICGITNLEDALAAAEAGADALGFVFAESSRRIEAHTAWSIMQKLPPFVTTVGVWANEHADAIRETQGRNPVQLIQLHGEIRGDLALLGWWRLIRAISISSEEDIRQAEKQVSKYPCAAILLDTHVEGKLGGTGQTFDWDLAVKAKSLGKPIILAGGLTPENVEEAVRKVRPHAVDVSTGVEISPGKKDHEKIKEFIRNARKAE